MEAGQSTELRCLPPVGVPPPRVYWLRNNVPVDTESDTLLVSSEGHLLVGQAKLSHQANYSEPVSLTVYGEFLVQFFVTDINLHDIKFMLRNSLFDTMVEINISI